MWKELGTYDIELSSENLEALRMPHNRFLVDPSARQDGWESKTPPD